MNLLNTITKICINISRKCHYLRLKGTDKVSVILKQSWGS